MSGENSDEEFKLYVTVEKAKITRILESKQDPYVTIILGDQKYSTKPQMDVATNPIFNETFILDIIEETELTIELYDYDDPQKSDLIGKGVCSVKGLKKKVEKKLEVQVNHRHKAAGTIFLKVKIDIPPKPIKPIEEKKEEPKAEPENKEEPEKKEEEPEIKPEPVIKVEPKPKTPLKPLKKLPQINRQPIESMQFVNYFYSDPHLYKILTQGLMETHRAQPKNPVIFLGEYLLKYTENSK